MENSLRAFVEECDTLQVRHITIPYRPPGSTSIVILITCREYN
jgi:hypothetical protein